MAGRDALIVPGSEAGRAQGWCDAPPDGDQYLLPVELADTVQGVSSEQRLHGCPGRVAIDTADGSVLRVSVDPLALRLKSSRSHKAGRAL